MMVTQIDAGPRKVSRSADVRAPAQELFAVIADPHRHGELDGSGTVKDTMKGPRRLSQDARFSVNMKQYGVPYRITSRVTQYVTDRVVEWQHPLGHRWRWELARSRTARRALPRPSTTAPSPGSRQRRSSSSGCPSETPQASRQR